MTTSDPGGAVANGARDHYTVYPLRDCIHEPKFSGDEAKYAVVGWQVWKNPEERDGWRSCDEVFDFDANEEAEARQFADNMNADAEKKSCTS